jgi:Ulp1 family protease
LSLHYQYFTEGLRFEIQRLLDLVGLKKEWELKVVDVPQQENTFDCGIYALQTIKCLVLKTDPPKWLPTHMEPMRSMMAMEICEGAIRWKLA